MTHPSEQMLNDPEGQQLVQAIHNRKAAEELALVLGSISDLNLECCEDCNRAIAEEIMEDAIDPEESILEEYIEATEEDHDNEDCLVKFRRNGFCFGTSCKHLDEGLRIQTLCPCKCHEGEDL